MKTETLFLTSAVALSVLTVFGDPPAILNQPINMVVPAGQPATLSVTGAGDGPLNYQWLKDGAMLPGRTDATLEFSDFQFTNSGSYSVVISNADGIAISLPARLSVSNAPLRTWGDNAAGKLGIGRTGGNTNQPVWVTNDVVLAAGGANHSLFVKADGTLWAMGDNSAGQLGIGTTGGSTNVPVLVTNDVVAVAAGSVHSFFVRADGTLFAMGNNNNGKLGIGMPAGGSTNVPVAVAANVVAVAAGGEHSLFIQADGTLWAMGYNSVGQLGTGSLAPTNRPAFVTRNVVTVAAGSDCSLFVRTDGTLWSMGNNNFGQLGIGMVGGSTNRPAPVTTNVAAIAAGATHSCFVLTDGSLYAMGNNSNGKLGIGMPMGVGTNAPVLVTTNAVTIAAGTEHSLFAKADGTLWAMGANNLGQLGIALSAPTNRPVVIGAGRMIGTSLAKGPMANHALAIAYDRPRVDSLHSQFVKVGQPAELAVTMSGGDGPFAYQWQKDGVDLLNATNASCQIDVVAMSNAGNYTLTAIGPFEVYEASINLAVLSVEPVGPLVGLGRPASLSVSNLSTGFSSYQWLKDGAMLPGRTDVTLEFPDFQFTNSGSYSVMISNADGIAISLPALLSVSNAPLRTWGDNAAGKLGIGRTGGSTNQPAVVTNDVVLAAGGANHSLFVKADGTLWAMGDNSAGQLGIGTTGGSTNVPVLVTNDVVAVAAGSVHSFFVRADGTLFAMGNNNNGKLGIGMPPGGSTNVPVAVAANVVTVAAGAEHSLFIQADGTLWAMGYNSLGQLGTGSTAPTNRPAFVTNNVVTVAAGSDCSLFVRTDGTLWSMGNNNFGQLGIGMVAGSTNRPALVTTNVAAIAAGATHSCFVLTDGSLYAMGNNNNGKLGIGMPMGVGTNAPVLVTTNAVTIAAGTEHSLFAKADGTLWAMGANNLGQLGIALSAPTNRPVVIGAGRMIGTSLAKGPMANHALAVGYLTPRMETPAIQMVNVGQPVSLTVAVSGGDGPFTFQWEKDGASLVDETNTHYSILSAALADAGDYKLTASGPWGSTSTSVNLTVKNPPVITFQPSSAVVGIGQPATLSVTNGGQGQFTYQWLKDGAMLTGRTEATLEFSDFQFTNIGSYSVVISNADGIAISLPALLSVSNAPLRAWGDNNLGKLGIGRTGGSTNQPAVVMNDVVLAAGGANHSLFVKADGTLWAMGDNSAGQLGIGTTGGSTNVPVLVTNDVVAVAAGSFHSFFVRADGTLFAMGNNNNGKLGIGMPAGGSTNVPVTVAANVVAVAAGSEHSLIVKSDGTLWGMGANSLGQLGTSSSAPTNRPAFVTNEVVAAAAGANHSLFLKTDGTVWAMGDNAFGQLGIGMVAGSTNRPALVTTNVAAIAAGATHSLFVLTDGSLYAMGNNSNGKLGIGMPAGGSTNVPVAVSDKVVAIAAGAEHSLFAKADGTLWAMGANNLGQLGIVLSAPTNRPVVIGGGRMIGASLVKGPVANHALAVAYVGPVVSGLHDHFVNVGQPAELVVTMSGGDGPFAYQWQKDGVDLLNATNAGYQIDAAAISDAGTYTLTATSPFGSTRASVNLTVKNPPVITFQPSSAVVGVGQPATLSVTNGGPGPFGYRWLKDGVVLPGLTNSTLTFADFQFTNSGSYSVVISNADGITISFPALLSVSNAPLRAWGYNFYGQLGTGTNDYEPQALPILVTNNVVSAAAGFWHSIFITPDRTLWTMGVNLPQNIPSTNKPVRLTNGVVAVAVGYQHSLFIRTNGTLWGVGWNDYGQCGTNQNGFITSNVVAVAAGEKHTLFIKADGTLWAMGRNDVGQLGIGITGGSTNVPVLVTNNVIAAACGMNHSLFVRADGTLWAMGYNNAGQLGIGSTITTTNRPVWVTNNVAAVAAGSIHSLILKADGTLWGMGHDGYGQLGTGPGTSSMLRPTFVTNNAVAIAAGENHSLFVKTDGTLWAMGDNDDGQLGIGTTTDSDRPAQVGGGMIAASLAKAPMADHSLAVAGVAPVLDSLPDITANFGQAATFTAPVSGGDGPFTYQWQKNGTNLTGAIYSSYTLNNVALTDAGSYAVVVTGPCGRTLSTSSKLRINTLFITDQPTSRTVQRGQAASLSVTNDGVGPYSYQWLKDGVILPRQTNATLAFADFQFTNSGVYNVVITNAGAFVISLPAAFSISNAPLRAWGDNYSGQLGIGISGGKTNSPTRVAGNVVAASCGLRHSHFTKADKTLWAMGDNSAYQLGSGPTATNLPSLNTWPLTNIVASASGSKHSLFLNADGWLFGAGTNDHGQLGLDPYTARRIHLILINSNVVAIAAGDSHSLFLKTDGTLWAMGDNQYGQLGIGSTDHLAHPYPVVVASNVVSIAAGGAHSLFVKRDGTLWGMGNNAANQLGFRYPANRPTLVTNNVIAIAAGSAHSLYIKTDGSLWVTGANGYGQLGLIPSSAPPQPIRIETNVMAIAAGYHHSLYLRVDGSIWAMGENDYGQLGIGSFAQTNYSVLVSGGLVAASLAKGPMASHCMAIAYAAPILEGMPDQIVRVGQAATFSGSVSSGDGPFTYQWRWEGSNIANATNTAYTITNASLADAGAYTLVVSSAFGSSSAAVQLTVCDPPVITAQPVGTAIGLGQSASLTVLSEGTPPFSYQWLKDGALLLNQTNSTLSFASFGLTNSGSYTVVISNAGGVAISIPASLGISNAPLFAWGANRGGQLGNGTHVNTNLPIAVSADVVLAASGSNHSLFVTTDGTLWAVGTNSYGQLGNGTIASTNRPTPITNNVVAVAAGASHSLFVRSDGTLWAMGNNNFGQLGIRQTGGIRTQPMAVTNQVVAVAAGANHSLFIRADGTLWGMGLNDVGQLGIFPMGITNRPVLVASNVVMAAAGAGHSLFVRSDGTLFGMGANSFGQLGIGHTANTGWPTEVTNNVVAIAGGGSHSLFVKRDASLWAMGNNNYGQLGAPAGLVNRPRLVALAGPAVWAVTAGEFHSVFVGTDGRVRAMGRNTYGQLGNGSLVQANYPTAVNNGRLLGSSLAKGPTGSHALAIATPVPYLNELIVNLRQPARFAVSVPDGMSFTYQWQWHGTNLVNETNAVYEIAATTLADAGLYTVISTGLFGTSSSSAWLRINREPSAPAFILGALSGETQTLLIIGGVNPPLDPDEDWLSVAGVTQGTNDAIVAYDSESVIYTPSESFTGTDYFDYIVSDHRGGYATGAVTVTVIARTPEHNLLSAQIYGDDHEMAFSYSGVPHGSYALDWTDSLESPISWTPLVTNAANAAGVLLFTNAPNESTNNFWRVRSVP